MSLMANSPGQVKTIEPLITGHEIVGTVEAVGPNVERIQPSERVGVPWLGWTCGECSYCRNGQENLCARARFTGYQIDGGYAEYAVAHEHYCFAIPPAFSDEQAAPLLCAGLIGYRALRLAGEGRHLGLYGFGAAAHIAIQVARHRGQEVYAFTRPSDVAGQAFARSLGAVWAGGSDAAPPDELDAAIIFAPVGALVPAALAATGKGGTVVCAGIHMSDIPASPTGSCGRSASCARWPISPAATARSSWRWQRKSRCAPRRWHFRWRRPTTRWQPCAKVVLRGLPC